MTSACTSKVDDTYYLYIRIYTQRLYSIIIQLATLFVYSLHSTVFNRIHSFVWLSASFSGRVAIVSLVFRRCFLLPFSVIYINRRFTTNLVDLHKSQKGWDTSNFFISRSFANRKIFVRSTSRHTGPAKLGTSLYVFYSSLPWRMPENSCRVLEEWTTSSTHEFSNYYIYKVVVRTYNYNK